MSTTEKEGKELKEASDLKALKEEIANLKKSLSAESAKRSAAEESALALSSANQFVTGSAGSNEHPTGKTITVNKCINPWERSEKKQKFVDLELPTYFYTINLPIGAGNSLMTNGIEYFHGQTYEFDCEILAEMKSRVAKCWDHESSISGKDENMYRKRTEMRV